MDVWKVAIALSMSSNHAAVLSALSSSLLGVHAQVNQLTGGFGRLKLAIGGAFAAGAGIALLDTMVKIVEKTKDYSDELVKLKQLGGDMLPAVSSGDMSKRAFDISQRVPMKVTDLLKIPGATYSILGQEDSMKVWEPLAKFSWNMQFAKDYKGDPGADLQKLIRASELTGRLTDPNTHKAAVEELNRFLDLSTKVMTATHGMVNPNTLLGMAQQGGFTMRGLSDEGFMTQAMIAQAMGGQRAGTAYLSLWQQMAGGTMLSRTAQGMQDVGLLKQSEWKNDHGHVILDNDASNRLTKLIGKDPLDLAANLVEHFKASGINDPLEQMRMVMRALGRQTTQRYTAEEVTNFHQMISERDRMKQALGSGSSYGLITNESVSSNIEAVQNAWNNLLTAVAGPNSENVISILKKTTDALNSVTAAVNNMNPDTLKNIGIGLGVLAAALTIAVPAALIAALSPAGWLVLGIAALGGAVVVWGDKIKSGLETARDFFLNLQQRVLGGITSMGDAIYSALKGVWDRITAIFGGGKSADPNAAKDSFKKDLEDANKNYVPMRFDPGARQQKAQPISLSLNVDGRTLAQAVSDQLTDLLGFRTMAPSADGVGGYHGANMQV